MEKEGMNSEEQLFGAVRRMPIRESLPTPTAELLQPLPDQDYATRFFCKSCGTTLPVLRTAVQQIAGSELPSYEGSYISVDRCNLCSGHFEGAHLRAIPLS
jgi:hypothetical protein